MKIYSTYLWKHGKNDFESNVNYDYLPILLSIIFVTIVVLLIWLFKLR